MAYKTLLTKLSASLSQ